MWNVLPLKEKKLYTVRKRKNNSLYIFFTVSWVFFFKSAQFQKVNKHAGQRLQY